jgi:hypothetical protein
MRRSLLKRPSPGLVLAVVALFVALGGGAYAATSDTKSDKKIANKAAKSYFNGHISGASVSHASTANSATSATNATNATNATSANTAKALTTLPSGATESGGFAASSFGLWDAVGITFQQPLAAPVAHVEGTTTTSANCPGPGQAAAGYLCLYVPNHVNISGCSTTCTPSFSYTDLPTGSGKFGVGLYWTSSVSGTGTSYLNGSWSTTAP